jgi:hypothetical protein
MKTRLLILLTATLVAISSVSAQENAGSGNFMLPLCRTWLRIHSEDLATIKAEISGEIGVALSRFEKAGLCAGFVIGVSEMLTMMSASPTPGMPSACIPKDANNDQLVRAVVNFADRHPEITHEDFVVLVGAAMSVAWPCPKTTKP